MGRGGPPPMGRGGPPLPRPILPRERGYMERLLEYVVGDGPSNRLVGRLQGLLPSLCSVTGTAGTVLPYAEMDVFFMWDQSGPEV